jgi:hypothetical protein
LAWRLAGAVVTAALLVDAGAMAVRPTTGLPLGTDRPAPSVASATATAAGPIRDGPAGSTANRQSMGPSGIVEPGGGSWAR